MVSSPGVVVYESEKCGYYRGLIGYWCRDHTCFGRGGFSCLHRGQIHGLLGLSNSETMQLEWLGKPIRITEIDPGFVETEFSLTRFGGDAVRASGVYDGMKPLEAADIADAIAWVVTRPAHVNIDNMVIRPLDHARIDKIFRK